MEDIVRLFQLKHVPTHHLACLTTDPFSFVKVINRKVKSLDGDVPCDGKGLPTFSNLEAFVFG